MSQSITQAFKSTLTLRILGALLLLVIVFALVQKSSKPEPTACTEEAMLCPDGVTSVGRSGPNCEFAACPGVATGSVATGN